MSGNTVAKAIEVLLVDDNLEDARVTIQSLKQEDIQWRVNLVGAARAPSSDGTPQEKPDSKREERHKSSCVPHPAEYNRG